MAGLTKRQKSTLSKHKVHHSPKHMAEMKKSMRTGDSFGKAHKKALRKVGK